MPWDKVEDALTEADSIAFDGCHKIYVLLDSEQTALMREYGYEWVVPVSDRNAALETLSDWYEDSCGLRFISSVATNHDDPNAGFENLISQFEFEEDEDEGLDEDEET